MAAISWRVALISPAEQEGIRNLVLSGNLKQIYLFGRLATREWKETAFHRRSICPAFYDTYLNQRRNNGIVVRLRIGITSSTTFDPLIVPYNFDRLQYTFSWRLRFRSTTTRTIKLWADVSDKNAFISFLVQPHYI